MLRWAKIVGSDPQAHHVSVVTDANFKRDSQ